MIVYVDVLILLNFLVDYFLLLFVAKLLNINFKIKRLILGALTGGISSLCIFFNIGYKILEILINLSVSVIICLVAFGFKNVKLFLKRTLLLYLVTLLYAAIMFLVHRFINHDALVINNSFVYLNISPLFLIVATVVIYICLALLKKIFRTDAKFSKRVKLSLCIENNKAELSAIIDSGNSIVDVFSKSEIIIVDKNTAGKLFKTKDFKNDIFLQKRYRIIPCSTVGGNGCLEGYRIDKACVTFENKEVLLEKPILAISKTEFCDDYQAILNPKILEYEVI